MKNTKIYIILAAALLLMNAVHAQVFIISDEEFLNSERLSQNTTIPFIPYQGGDSDQTLNYTPLGSGWLVLAGLGTAYLIRKRRKDTE